MTGKRPHQDDGDEGDVKRIRSNNGSPAPARTAGAADADSKKSELQERMAALKAKLAASKSNGAPPPPPPPPAAASAAAPTPPSPAAPMSDLEAKKAAAQKKIAEMKERMAAQRQGKSTASPVNGGAVASPPPPPAPSSEKEARIAEVRARAAKLAQQRNIEPTGSGQGPPPRQDDRFAKGGLGIGLHPSLMGDLSAPTAGRNKGVQGPKFSTTRGNQQPERPKINPYLPPEEETEDPRTDENYDASIQTRRGGDRKSKQLTFNERGKFMAQANALRQQARLEDMKRKIAVETRKTQIEEASDKSLLVPAPPDVEWWDEGLLPEGQNSYDNCLEDGRNKIATPDSIITALIQRPVLLQAPQDKFAPAAKALMLTKTEQKKMRRQRRMADMKEEQAKIRLGLVEPPPPKVKKSNMMRVLGEQAVKDPTAVEVRVNREIAQRQHDHEQANEDRKLTKDERGDKVKQQQAGDEAKGVKIAVFKVDDLSSGKHRYQIDMNAKQNGLTGIVVLHPTMNLIVVEGGAHSMHNYKKLMLNRIKWSENTLPLSNTNPSTFTQPAPPGSAADVEGGANKASQWCKPLDEQGQLKDLSENSCTLIWEGDEQTRVFRKWGSKAVETDGEARDVLGRQKMENMWTLARSK